MPNCSIWLIDWTWSGTITTGQSGPGNYGNEGVHYIIQNSGITGALQSDFVSYLGHSLGEAVCVFCIGWIWSVENVHNLLPFEVGCSAYGAGDWVSISGWVIPKTQKIVLDAALLNTQHYKVRIKGKVEQSREWSSTFPYNLMW